MHNVRALRFEVGPACCTGFDMSLPPVIFPRGATTTQEDSIGPVPEL